MLSHLTLHTVRFVTWARVGALLVVAVLSMFLADLFFPNAPAPSAISCATNAWCATNFFDVALTKALAHGPFRLWAMVSHILNFVVSPLLAIASICLLGPWPPAQSGSDSLVAAQPQPAAGDSSVPRRRQILQDLALLFSCLLCAIGVNSLAKVGAHRQRPCFHFGRQARPSLIPSLCTQFTRAGIEWRR